MLRSGQMVLAQGITFHLLGREWRLDSGHSAIYDMVLRWFADYPSAECPYSIHNIAQLGLKFGKNVGEWFGPSTISQVLEDLVADHNPGDLRLYASSDGCLYLDQIHALCTSGKECGTRSVDPKDKEKEKDKETETKEAEADWKPLIILIPLRLGLDTLNSDYIPAVKEVFHYPQSLGIIGGRPRSSLYFVGYQDDDVFYLDPHTIQPAIFPMGPPEGQAGQEKPLFDADKEETVVLEKTFIASYHCPVPQKIPISDMDPSLAVAFYCRDKKQFDDFCKRSVNSPIFNVEKKTPEYLVKKPPVEHHEKLFSDDDDDFVFL